jgi:putative ABC transport system permease protein
MDIISKFTIRNLKKNKKRSIGTIVGIMLATALMYTVVAMFANFIATMKQACIDVSGYYHVEIPYCDKDTYKELNDNNYVKFRMDYKEFCEKSNLKYEKKAALTEDDKKALRQEGIEPDNSVDCYVALNEPKNIDDFEKLLIRQYKIPRAGINENSELLAYETFRLSDNTMSSFIAIVAIILGIIVVATVFCIRNSFLISATEKKKMYGMLASIGATRKQIKKSVRKEGAALGAVGIPLGLVLGNAAVFILIKVLNIITKAYFRVGAIDFKMVISVWAVLLSIVLPIITIMISSKQAERQASKASPIENFRMSEDVKIDSRKLKTPAIIKKLFGIGGVVAYKNLKRSGKKYRTTVISLTVSIFLFIGVYAFINEGLKQQSMQYGNTDYNLVLYKSSDLDAIKKAAGDSVVYPEYAPKDGSYAVLDSSKLTKNGKKENKANGVKESDREKYGDASVVALDEKDFKNFSEKTGADYQDTKGKAIFNSVFVKTDKSGKRTLLKKYAYKAGDKITYKGQDIVIGKITDKLLSEQPYNGATIVVEKSYLESITPIKNSWICINAKDPNATQKAIEKADPEAEIMNIAENVRSEQGMILILSIFFYGFIIVVSLIGVTNIFNTITSNMELRQSELAMFKSMGMTRKEFRRMINLETVFYSTKSLVYGTLIGTLISYLLYKAFAKRMDMGYTFPIEGIVICIIAVFVIVSCIMHYSVSKIEKQNIIATIRNENI